MRKRRVSDENVVQGWARGSPPAKTAGKGGTSARRAGTGRRFVGSGDTPVPGAETARAPVPRPRRANPNGRRLRPTRPPRTRLARTFKSRARVPSLPVVPHTARTKFAPPVTNRLPLPGRTRLSAFATCAILIPTCERVSKCQIGLSGFKSGVILADSRSPSTGLGRNDA